MPAEEAGCISYNVDNSFFYSIVLTYVEEATSGNETFEWQAKCIGNNHEKECIKIYLLQNTRCPKKVTEFQIVVTLEIFDVPGDPQKLLFLVKRKIHSKKGSFRNEIF